ncbi:MAG: ABC transporter permease [Oscillochloridaceae bacterium umkhey_bin13]
MKLAATNLVPSVGRPDLQRWLHALWPPLLTFVLALGLWEGAVRGFGIPLYLLPAPSQILATFLERPGFLFSIGLVTFGNALAGCLIGCTLGCLVAAACVRWPIAADGLVPLAVAASAVPIIALSPLMGIWLGSISPASKIAVVAVMTFFPTLVGVYKGLSSPRADALLLMRSYAASQRTVFLKLRIPAALPFFFNALRLCTTLSMIGAVVAEFFGGPRNALGVYIKTQAGILRTREAWSAILVACLFGLAFYLAVVVIERAVMPWRRRS